MNSISSLLPLCKPQQNSLNKVARWFCYAWGNTWFSRNRFPVNDCMELFWGMSQQSRSWRCCSAAASSGLYSWSSLCLDPLWGSPWPLVFQADSGHTHQIPLWQSWHKCYAAVISPNAWSLWYVFGIFYWLCIVYLVRGTRTPLLWNFITFSFLYSQGKPAPQ